MKYLVLSDIHANLEALDAALTSTTFERVVVLGDIVGYGADPNAVIERIRGLDAVVIRGNHDRAACDGQLTGFWSYAAVSSIVWTMAELTTGNRAYLASLPEGPLVVDDCFEICHGALANEDLYILTPEDAAKGLDASRKRICFFGHTHLPIAFSRLFKDVFRYVPPIDGGRYDLKLRHMRSYLVNPGSVGQPRDRDSRAACALFDSEKMHVTFLREDYDVAGAQRKIERFGLAQYSAERLALGK